MNKEIGKGPMQASIGTTDFISPNCWLDVCSFVWLVPLKQRMREKDFIDIIDVGADTFCVL